MQVEKKKITYNRSIRNSIFIYFTVSSLVAVLLIVISIYSRLSSQLSDTVKQENISLINRVNASMEVYLRNIMKLSDTIYYGIIKNVNLSEASINEEMTLLYNNNKEQVLNIALISKDGKPLSAVPAARFRKNFEVRREEWFINALNKTENIHFTRPHVQKLFEKGDNSYRWVVTMSRAVEITMGGSTEQAVLLIDMAYQGFDEVLDEVSLGSGGYIYLMDSKGEIIWHPKFELIASGRIKENNLVAASYSDGSTEEEFNNANQTVVIKTVGYTGWKLVGVIKGTGISLNTIKTRLFIVFVIFLIIFIVVLINSYISFRVTDPIRELEKSVKKLEEGNLDAEIYMGGSYEIQHLGKTVQDMKHRIKGLMQDIVTEHEEKRKSEFDSLQAQINPHFLYNTLDIIVWQIENEKQSEAVHTVTALARFFRLSLGKGKNIVTVKAEIDHVKNYLMIQHMRFKNKFDYEFEIAEDVLGLSSLKLMLQPLVENAIYHGMEFMDGDGLIIIKAWREAGELYLFVTDNGLGMTEDKVSLVLSGKSNSGNGRGSGIGVKNVNERIKLYFGDKYGLKIDSEPDVGTTIIIHLPAKEYEEENI
ncbi:MAG: sensor histidine kinase [Catonella sp.]|uniref:sensor histidine kinase n=1 Tax=Catonella sp. TaxID=2382125 RepID=UPI003F9F67DF